MIFSNFLYLSIEQRKLLRKKVFKLLESYGVKLDPHPEMFKNLKNANLQEHRSRGPLKYPSTSPCLLTTSYCANIWKHYSTGEDS